MSESCPSHEETDLLRHFRYNLALWIDIADPEASFGIKVMLAAKDNKPLLSAILSLAATHKLLLRPEQRLSLHDRRKFREAADYGLAEATTQTRHIGNLLLLLGDYLSSNPQQWQALILSQIGDTYPSPFAAFEGDLNEPTLWLHFRLGRYFLPFF